MKYYFKADSKRDQKQAGILIRCWIELFESE